MAKLWILGNISVLLFIYVDLVQEFLQDRRGEPSYECFVSLHISVSSLATMIWQESLWLTCTQGEKAQV